MFRRHRFQGSQTQIMASRVCPFLVSRRSSRMYIETDQSTYCRNEESVDNRTILTGPMSLVHNPAKTAGAQRRHEIFCRGTIKSGAAALLPQEPSAILMQSVAAVSRRSPIRTVYPASPRAFSFISPNSLITRPPHLLFLSA